MQNSLLQIIKKAALETVENSKPVEILNGLVTSLEPLRIKLNQFLTIDENFIIKPESLFEHELEINVNEQRIILKDENEESKEYEVTAQKIKVRIESQIKENDKLLLLRTQGAQKYLILDKVKNGNEDD